MPIPIFFIIFVLFLLFFTYKTNKVRKDFEKNRQAFWELEKESNFTRKKSIDDLLYILVDFSSLPFNCYPSDSKLVELEQKIKAIAKLPMVDLRDKNNTELKLAYGSANLDDLTVYEANYMSLLRYLYKWGKHLAEIGSMEHSIKVLEYGIQLDTDISDHYILLGSLYKDHGYITKIDMLISKAEQLNTLLKNKIIRNLKAMKN